MFQLYIQWNRGKVSMDQNIEKEENDKTVK